MSEELNEVVTDQVETTETPAVETPEVKTVTMTQAELDALIGKEKGRVKSKYADYNDLKTKLSTFEQAEKERQEAEMTELEKLQAQLAEKDTKEQTLAQQLADLEEAVQNEKIRNAFNQIATSNQIAHLDDAFVLADLSAVTVEDGKVVGMEDAIKALVDNKPFLITKKQPKPIGESTNGNTERADKTAEQLLNEAAAKAKASGRNEDRMAYAALKAELNK
ncbi:Clp protease ClpB [Peribacillus frigoritolerans]|uniref:phage scaffolding protein n=1 Tax=Peribacillus frigoritolerans TaxID=450367 RepID=UPI002E243F7E|nr:Clp protease ClpB [Peribacillus frigoritolerans]MED3845529.1 Clp protease ClpB [Peribacillus frigoritolerans]